MKCGSCKGSHQTVAEVRRCHGLDAGSIARLAEFDRRTLGELDWDTRTVEARQNAPANLDEQRARQTYRATPDSDYGSEPGTIDRRRAASAPEFPDVPAGHYAVEIDGTLKFYRVDRPDKGKWKGWTFLSVRASDESYPIKNRAAKRAILEEIAKDPDSAGERFGREIGRCYKCYRSLTDETSRALGIGPDCRSQRAA